MSKAQRKVFEYVEPIGARVLVRKDEPKRTTKGGIALPDAAEIPTITGRIVSISAGDLIKRNSCSASLGLVMETGAVPERRVRRRAAASAS